MYITDEDDAEQSGRDHCFQDIFPRVLFFRLLLPAARQPIFTDFDSQPLGDMAASNDNAPHFRR